MITKTKNITKEEKEIREKKIAIAQDVIKQLRYIKPICGTYITGELQDTMPKDAQEAVKKGKKNCEVCGIGAMFLSYVNLFDQIDLSDIIKFNYDNPKEWYLRSNGLMAKCILGNYFSVDELYNIESCFEGFIGHIDFKRNNPDHKKRLKLIMQNIIDNNGQFIPEQLCAS